jgi:anhydro-N-acetylmuramic acid kinase
LISGTSLDGLDAAVVAFHGDTPSLIGSYFKPLPPALREHLAQMSLASQWPAQTFGEVDALLGDCLAHCALAAIADTGLNPSNIRAIGSHGVTVRHSPDSTPAFTLQLGDANRIAAITGITTVADFRRRDVAVGGQGAPLVPAFHQAVFSHPAEHRAVLNIGGIANLTLLPPDPAQTVLGFDTGPGNTLLDSWAGRHLGEPVDMDGEWGRQGQCLPGLLERCLADDYFQRPPPKSTGKERFSPDWLQAQLDSLADAPQPADVQATLAHLTARSIGQALHRYAPATQRLLVCGGGVHNRLLLELLAQELSQPGGQACQVESTVAQGLDPDWIEAMAFAWLARQTLLGRPGNLPAATGAKRPVVLGAIYPGCC